MKKINIPLSDQVVDLETARELTEKLESVGIEVESAFCWGRSRDNKYQKWPEWSVRKNDSMFKWCLNDAPNKEELRGLMQIITAYTLPELLAVLPAWIPSKWQGVNGCEYGSPNTCAWFGRCNGGGMRMEKDENDYTIGYMCREGCFINYESLDNPASTAAKLLIDCIDNGYIKGE